MLRGCRVLRGCHRTLGPPGSPPPVPSRATQSAPSNRLLPPLHAPPLLRGGTLPWAWQSRSSNLRRACQSPPLSGPGAWPRWLPGDRRADRRAHRQTGAGERAMAASAEPCVGQDVSVPLLPQSPFPGLVDLSDSSLRRRYWGGERPPNSQPKEQPGETDPFNRSCTPPPDPSTANGASRLPSCQQALTSICIKASGPPPLWLAFSFIQVLSKGLWGVTFRGWERESPNPRISGAR